MRQMGKTLLAKKILDDFLKKNPDAIIAHCSKNEIKISKPGKGITHEIVSQKQLKQLK